MTLSSQGNYKNLIEILDNSRKKYSDRPLFGTKRDGNYEWTTYEQFAEKVDELRGGLASLGVTSGDKVAIISKTLKNGLYLPMLHMVCADNISRCMRPNWQRNGSTLSGTVLQKYFLFQIQLYWNKLLISLNV